MKSNRAGMTCIELFGIPGAGKTTIAAPVVARLREDGYIVADLSMVYSRNCSEKSKKKVVFEMLFSWKNYPLYFQLLNYGLTVSSSSDNFKFLFKFIFLVHQLSKVLSERRFDIILCEEGIIQFLSSLSYKHTLPETKLLKRCTSAINNRITIEAVNCV